MVYHSLTSYFFSKHVFGGFPNERMDTKFECYKCPVVESSLGRHREQFGIRKH